MNARRKHTPEDNGRDKRMDILHAAFDVISEMGLYKTTVEAVARRAQVAKGTVYLYFKSKEDLFVEMVVDRLEHAHEEVLEAISREEGTWPKLRTAIRIHFRHMLLVMSHLMVGEGLMKLGARHIRKLAKARQAHLEIYEKILTEHFEHEGEVRFSPKAAALALTGGMAGYVFQMHESRGSVPAPDEYLKTFEAIVLPHSLEKRLTKMKANSFKLGKWALPLTLAAALMLPMLAAASDDAVPVKKKAPAQVVVTSAQSAPEESASQDEQPTSGEGAQPMPPTYTLTAEELIKLALDNSFALRIAEKNAESTYYQYLKYVGMAGGSFDLTGSWKRSGPGQKTPPITQKETTGAFSASFSYPLAPLGNLGYGKQAAWSGYMASASQVDSTRAQTISGVFSAYVNYLTAVNGVKVAEEGLALAEEQLKNAQAKFENDVSPRFEVIQGNVAVSQARESLIQAKNGVDLARSALYLAVGITPETQFSGMEVQIEYAEALDRAVGHISGDIFPELDAQSLFEAFSERTPQYYALVGQVGMYHYQVLANKRAPFFSLDASYTHLTGFPMSEPNSWLFGISGKLNLWDAGATEATKNSFRAQADASSLQLEQYKQGFRLNVDSALSTLQTSIEGYQTAQNTLEQATEALRMARLGYREGVVTHADLVGARTAYLGAELNEFSARMSVVTSYQSLLTLLGIGNADLYLPTTTSDLSAITAGVISNEKN